jgi:hypothetical protein
MMGIRTTIGVVVAAVVMWQGEHLTQQLLLYRTGAYSLEWHIQTQFRPSQLALQLSGVLVAGVIAGVIAAAAVSSGRLVLAIGLAILSVVPWAAFAIARQTFALQPLYPPSWQAVPIATSLAAAVLGAFGLQTCRPRRVSHAV